MTRVLLPLACLLLPGCGFAWNDPIANQRWLNPLADSFAAAGFSGRPFYSTPGLPGTAVCSSVGQGQVVCR